MKHLRLYEELDYKFREGDYVILIKESEYSKTFGYTIGDLCQVISFESHDDNYPYEIRNISNEDAYDLWINYDQIEMAEPHIASQIKYNL